MIQLDDRIGSGELLPYFRPYGIRVEKVRLPFGDVAWEGSGPNGRCMIGLERKRLDDLVQSMQSGRLSGHQLPGMVETYDYGYLLVEGIWRTSQSTGEVEVLERSGKWERRGIQVRALHNYLFGLSLRAGMLAWKTSNERETVEFVVDQYRMWEKPWEDHSAHEQTYTGAVAMELAGGGELGRGGGRRLFLNVRPPTNAEIVACVMPGIGRKLSYRVGKKFGCVANMVRANEVEWGQIKGVSVAMGRKLRDWFYE